MKWKNAPNFVFLLALPMLCLIGSLHHRHALGLERPSPLPTNCTAYSTATPQQLEQQNSIRMAVFQYQCAEYHYHIPASPLTSPLLEIPVTIQTTGAASVRLSLSALRWVSPSQVEVDGNYYRSPQSVGGSTYLVICSPDGCMSRTNNVSGAIKSAPPKAS